MRTFVEASLREFLGAEQLDRDRDGDIPIRFGSAMAFVRLLEGDFPSMHVFAPVVWGLTRDQEILEAVNHINRSIRFGRAIWEDGAVVVAIDLPASMVTKESVGFACEVIGTVANHFDNQLQDRFGGSIMFGEALPPKSSHIGGYL